MRTVITYGTFDLLHYGHIEIFRRAKDLAAGGKLIVGVSTDEFNWNEKRKKSHMSYKKRKELVESIIYVDEVIPEKDWDQKKDDIKRYGVDVFVMGSDWDGEFDELKKLCDVHYLSRTPDISSTALRDLASKTSKTQLEVL